MRSKRNTIVSPQHWLGALLACTFIGLLASTAFTQAQLIRGEVIDVECYVAQGARGESHKQCAIACIKGGQPSGILEEKTGKIYLVVTEDHATNPSEKIMPYIAKTVEVDGTVKERGGISVIDIKSIREIGTSARQESPKDKGPTL